MRHDSTYYFEMWELKQEEFAAMELPYKAYINSHYWRDKADRLKQQKGCCELCGSTDRLECHHLNYLHVGYELPEDLQVVCTACHSELHR